MKTEQHDAIILSSSEEKDIQKQFVAATGWKPEIKFDQTLEDLLDYWRDYFTREKGSRL